MAPPFCVSSANSAGHGCFSACVGMSLEESLGRVAGVLDTLPWTIGP